MNKKIIHNYLIIFILIFFSLGWALKLYYDWSFDYGFWYVTSIFFDENYTLYKDELANKGPFYFFFINILSKFIGYGTLQAYLTLSLTLSLTIC